MAEKSRGRVRKNRRASSTAVGLEQARCTGLPLHPSTRLVTLRERGVQFRERLLEEGAVPLVARGLKRADHHVETAIKVGLTHHSSD